MSTQSEAAKPAVTTYCPFKAPDRLVVPFGDRLTPLRRFEQRPGMALVHATLPSLDSDEELCLWPIDAFLQIVFVSRGRLVFVEPDGRQTRVDSGAWLVLKPAQTTIRFCTPDDCLLHWIECDEQASASLTGFSDTVAPQLKDRLNAFLATGAATGRLLTLGQEIGELQGSDTRERLLVEAKTLEWLATLLDQPVFSPCRAIVPQRDAREEAALTSAARILDTRCEEDHSIAQLSREVHLNEFKLKRGFRQRFNTTVFGYLRQRRMERARELLQSKDASVIEVANAVGYSNPSHFARAFKEAYGVNPSDFARKE